MGLNYYPTEIEPDAPSETHSGLAGWRWIFICQGILTVIVAVIGYVFIVDFPEMTLKQRYLFHFLDKKEIDLMIARVEKDREDVKMEP